MKVKLITFAPHPNFGTCLQSYALNYVLRQMGHDVEFIYNKREVKPASFPSQVKQLIKRILPSSAYKILKKMRGESKTEKVEISSEPYIIELPNHPILKLCSKLPFYKSIHKSLFCKNEQWRKVYKFTFEDGNFNMRRIYTLAEYEEVAKDTDIFITGSDQIWNPFCGGFNPMMFVEFGDGVKKVSYSSSISQLSLPKSVENRIKDDLGKFSHIAVREQRSVELLNALLGRNDVKLVVDPTYLLTAKEWEKFGENADLDFEIPEKYIFCYFIGSKRIALYVQMVEEVKVYTGIDKVISLECYGRDMNFGNGRLYSEGGPYEWVYLLQHASYVCMDSFHATVFALKFHKDFVHALKNDDGDVGSQNTRMYDILSRYGLLNKIYHDKEDKSWQAKIDYSKVDQIINSEIGESIKFLRYELAE